MNQIKAIPITHQEIQQAQDQWGHDIVTIGSLFQKGDDYRVFANECLHQLYDLDEGVLFRPTMAIDYPFRTSSQELISYFIGGCVAEDQGFAVKPWKRVRFATPNIIIKEDTAMAMGHYFFTSAHSDEEIQVEYTFVYHRDSSGALKIVLHHSSLPNHQRLS